MNADSLRYPVGVYLKPEIISKEIFQTYVQDIQAFPERLNAVVQHLPDERLNTPYRPGGWTIRQVVHHCADSHMNALIRIKLALTEEEPTIKPYREERWAELPDSKNMPLAPSLKLIEAVHERWVSLLNSLTDEDLKRTYYHPENEKTYRLDESTGLYAWHCRHHLAHIKQTL